jgi:MOSC domain-containing protein YiiM
MSSMLGRVLSVNVAVAPSPTGVKDSGATGIGKTPVAGPVAVHAPGPKGVGGSGLAGDNVVDRRHHGGDDQAVYAYAREDLDWWQAQLGRALPGGAFGENLTTSGVDVTGARLGERWRVGDRVVLEVSAARIPCAVFAERMGTDDWIKQFTERATPGAYLRVVQSGTVRPGDPVTLVHRPVHQVTVGLFFRALTTEPHLLPELLAAGDALAAGMRETVLRRTGAPDAPDQAAPAPAS